TQGHINGVSLPDLHATLQNKNFQVRAPITIASGSLRGAPLGATHGQLIADNQAIALNGFQSALMGGNARGDLVLNLARGASQLKASFNGLQTAALFNLAAIHNAPLA